MKQEEARPAVPLSLSLSLSLCMDHWTDGIQHFYHVTTHSFLLFQLRFCLFFVYLIPSFCLFFPFFTFFFYISVTSSSIILSVFPSTFFLYLFPIYFFFVLFVPSCLFLSVHVFLHFLGFFPPLLPVSLYFCFHPSVSFSLYFLTVSFFHFFALSLSFFSKQCHPFSQITCK